MFPQDTVHAGHTLRRLSPIVHEVVADAGGSCSRDTQCLTHHEWYHTCLLVCFLQLTDTTKGPPSTTIGGRRASQEGFWGGYLRQTLRTMPKETHLPTRVEETWDVAWWTYIWRGMLANHLGSSNHFVF